MGGGHPVYIDEASVHRPGGRNQTAYCIRLTFVQLCRHPPDFKCSLIRTDRFAF